MKTFTKQQKRNIIKFLIDDGGLDWAKDNKDFWTFISSHFNLYEEFVREYRDFLNWEEICKNKVITDNNVLREFRKEIDWAFLGYNSSIKLTKKQKKEFEEELKGFINE